MRFCKPILFAGLGMICGASSVALLTAVIDPFSSPSVVVAADATSGSPAANTASAGPAANAASAGPAANAASAGPAANAASAGSAADANKTAGQTASSVSGTQANRSQDNTARPSASGEAAVHADARSLTGPRTPPRPLVKPPVPSPVQPVSLQPGTDSIAPSADAASVSTKVVTVGRGDTLMSVLDETGVDRQDAHTAIEALSKVYNPRDLKVGEEITVIFSVDEEGEQSFQGFSFQPNPALQVTTSRDDDGFSANQLKARLTDSMVRFEGEIDSSLFEAASQAGVPHQVLAEFIRIFSYDVDFQRDIQKGDRFQVVYNHKTTPDGDVVGGGEILYAAMTLSGETMALYRHTDPDGGTDYYNGKGESIRKALLRTPINGARLSSGFGSRKHPVLGYTKMHKGVDFAAPTGTPIYAAGDGVIEMAGDNGSYGNYVRIRHTPEYATAYAHMSRVGQGMRNGARVRQGDVIGYVGSTGRSTGPHLHYEILQRGQQVNPLGVRFPTGRKLAGADLKRFEGTRQTMQKTIASLPEGLPGKTASR